MTEDIAREIDPQIDAKRSEAERMAWGGATPTVTASTAAPAGGEGPAATGGALEGLSLEQLEQELQRRKSMGKVPGELRSDDK